MLSKEEEANRGKKIDIGYTGANLGGESRDPRFPEQTVPTWAGNQNSRKEVSRENGDFMDYLSYDELEIIGNIETIAGRNKRKLMGNSRKNRKAAGKGEHWLQYVPYVNKYEH